MGAYPLPVTGTFEKQLPWDYIRRTMLMAGLGFWQIIAREKGGLIFLVNDNFLSMTGHTKDSFPRDFEDFQELVVHPDDRELSASVTRKSFSGEGAQHEMILRLRCRSHDQWRWMKVFGEVAERKADGTPQIMFGCVIDIHESYIAGEKLAASEAALKTEHKRLAAIIEAADLVVWDWNLESETIRYGDALNYTGEDGLGEPVNVTDHWATALSPEDQSKVLAARLKHLSGDSLWYESEVPIKRPKSGDVFWGLDRGRTVEWSADGRPIRMMGVTIDITNSRKAQIELDESHKKLQQMIEAANIAAWEWDVPTDSLSVNTIYSKIMGRDQSELESLRERWFDYLHPEDHQKMRQTIESLVEGVRESGSVEYRLLTDQGHHLWFYGLFRALDHDATGRATRIVGAQLDFTERKKLEESQARYLALICRQKEALEKQVDERTLLLEEIRQEVEDLIKSPGNRLDSVQTNLMQEILKLQGRFAANGEINGLFRRYLTLAFKFITNERMWYRAILDSLPFPTSVFNANRNWVYLNPSTAEAMGGEVEDYIGRHYREGWGDYQDSELSFSAADPAKKSFTRYLPEAGRYYSCQSSALRDENNRSVGFIETMQDVTSAHEAETRVRLMLDAMPLACLVFDRSLAILDCNREAAHICGLADKGEFIQRFLRLMPPALPDGRDPVEALMRCVRQAFDDGSATMAEMVIKDTDGVDIPCEIYMTRVDWRDDYIVLAYFRDLRSLRSTQKKLDQERLLLKEILNGSPVPFFIAQEGKVIFATPCAYRNLGLKTGDRTESVFPEREDLDQIIRQVKKKGTVNWRPVKFRRREGSVGSGLLNLYRISYNGGKANMAWLMDITELKNKEKELEVALDLAEESTRAKSSFLANISHEIRTPMNAVIGLTHLLLNTALTTEQRQYAEKVDISAKSLLHLINDILDFSKIEAGKMKLSDSRFSLAECIGQNVDIISHQATGRNLEMILDVDPDLPLELVGDDFRLLQILNNLASNALKFTEEGEISLTVEKAEEGEDDITLRFLMRDSGIGIDPDKAADLFSAFTQADVSTTRRYGGTGLGLTICKKLVDLFGGEIWCESAPGQGSLFGFTARFKKAEGTKKYIEPEACLGGRTALVIGPEVRVLGIFEKYLKALGLTVITATGAREAERLMKEKAAPLDLIVIDQGRASEPMASISFSGKKWARGVPVLAAAWGLGRAGGLGGDWTETIEVLLKPITPTALTRALLKVFGADENCYNRLGGRSPQVDNPADLVGHLAGARILLAEDNELNQLVALKIMKKAGLEVTVANNGQQALDLIAAQPPFDLVLMDIQMPVMDGLTATAEIRRTYDKADLPIVAMTAHALPQDREKSLAAGMNDHIVKPLDVAELFACLARLIKSPHSAPAPEGGETRVRTE